VADTMQIAAPVTSEEWRAHLTDHHPAIVRYWEGSPIRDLISKHNAQHGRWPAKQDHAHAGSGPISPPRM
jgi:hypothetical protein